MAFVNSTEEVSNIAFICNEEECPIVAWGTGTSLEGNALAHRGGISINMMNMNKILKVNHEDMDVIVQPGVTREELILLLKIRVYFFQLIQGQMLHLEGWQLELQGQLL